MRPAPPHTDVNEAGLSGFVRIQDVAAVEKRPIRQLLA
jgi:hypothetical protein